MAVRERERERESVCPLPLNSQGRVGEEPSAQMLEKGPRNTHCEKKPNEKMSVLPGDSTVKAQGEH